MRALVRTGVVTLAVAALVGLGAAPHAAAATGEVVTFSHEFTELSVFKDPAGCHAMPLGAHIVLNETDSTIRVYADPLCLVPTEPFATIKAGYGSHVSAAGSFKA